MWKLQRLLTISSQLDVRGPTLVRGMMPLHLQEFRAELSILTFLLSLCKIIPFHIPQAYQNLVHYLRLCCILNYRIFVNIFIPTLMFQQNILHYQSDFVIWGYNTTANTFEGFLSARHCSRCFRYIVAIFKHARNFLIFLLRGGIYVPPPLIRAGLSDSLITSGRQQTWCFVIPKAKYKKTV